MAADVQKIYLEFENGPRAEATLQTEAAPKTAAAIWKALEVPVTQPVMHAMYAGPEIMFGLPEEAQLFDPATLPAENQQVVPAPGDLIWFHQSKELMAGLDFELWELGIFYGKGGRIFGPLGWTPCTNWASITSGLDEFAAACQETRTIGLKNLTIGRI
ncbi:DUF3830 family protein [Subtercola endophyticus]|uniref:DUF3830 family protein n=1 Tax=Subtercola endophyticus TaxID=2895559 RepID=UPI001E2B1E28|nr:DUF3830 family protein [Subtercola endophyticus]UFS57625.1 DUF3830 family protein [Subtercola endophyticus]